MALRKIFLYGHLAEKYGKEHSFDVNSVSEILRAFECSYKGFVKEIRLDEYYSVYCGHSVSEKTLLNIEEYSMTSTGGDYHVVPIISGSKGQSDKGAGSILIGVAFIAASFAFGWNPYLLMTGVGFLVTGAATLLTPVAEKTKSPDDVDNGTSFVFSNAKNTERQGGVVPLVYGTHLVGCTTVSSYMEATRYIEEVDNG